MHVRAHIHAHAPIARTYTSARARRRGGGREGRGERGEETPGVSEGRREGGWGGERGRRAGGRHRCRRKGGGRMTGAGGKIGGGEGRDTSKVGSGKKMVF